MPPPLAVIPVSYGNPGYTWLPFESFGPANAFSIAAACCDERQPSFFVPPPHTSVFGSNLQARVLKIIPSFTPSLASHALRRPSMTTLLSLSENACPGIG